MNGFLRAQNGLLRTFQTRYHHVNRAAQNVNTCCQWEKEETSLARQRVVQRASERRDSTHSFSNHLHAQPRGGVLARAERQPGL